MKKNLKVINIWFISSKQTYFNENVTNYAYII
jgi:hypothetical protein